MHERNLLVSFLPFPADWKVRRANKLCLVWPFTQAYTHPAEK